MREKIFPILFIILVTFLEITVTTLPLIIGTFILLTVVFRQNWIFVAAFLTGIIFDILTIRTIGTTSTFLVFMVFLIFLYQNKFEIQTIHFVFVSTTIASVLFLVFLGFSSVILQALLVGVVTTVLFGLLSFYLKSSL